MRPQAFGQHVGQPGVVGQPDHLHALAVAVAPRSQILAPLLVIKNLRGGDDQHFMALALVLLHQFIFLVSPVVQIIVGEANMHDFHV